MAPNLWASITVRTKLALIDIGRLSLKHGLGKRSRVQF